MLIHALNRLQSLKEKTQRRERRDSTSDEEEDESDDEEVEVDEDVAPFPMVRNYYFERTDERTTRNERTNR